jgi:hypothetical protein
MRKNTTINKDHKEKEDDEDKKEKTFVLCKDEKALGESTLEWLNFSALESFFKFLF